MIEKIPHCPDCGQADHVIKVNKVYVESLSIKPVPEERVIARVLRWPEEKPADSKRTKAEAELLRFFSPPAGKSVTTRPINPDMTVGIFSILVILLLYQIYTQQRNVFFIALGIVAVFYFIYFIGRKYIRGKFKQRLDEETVSKKTTEAAIGRWMKLYYCWEDGIVFNPKENVSIPLDQMRAKLLDSSNR